MSYTVVAVLVANLLATASDITETWTSPMYPKLYSNDSTINPLGRPITPLEDSWIGSLVDIGALVGVLPTGFLADKIGRKTVLLGVAVPHVIAYLLYAFAGHVYYLYVGRFLNGISTGASFVILPVYIAEITTDTNRGVLSVTMNIFWTIGNFIPYALGPYSSSKIFNLVLAAIPSIFFIVFLCIDVETPHYLVQTGKEIQAKDVVKRLRSCTTNDALKEVTNIKTSLKPNERLGPMEIFKSRPLRKSLIIIVILMVLQECFGLRAIEFYLEPIFESSEDETSAAKWSTIVGGCLIVFSIIPTFLVGRVANKTLLAISCLGDSLMLVFLGAYFNFYDHASTWLLIALVTGFLFFHNLAFATLPWTISAELFPNHVKAISSSVTAYSHWLASFFIIKYFNSLNDAIGRAGTFWFYAGACFFTVLFNAAFLPETGGKSFLEIQEMLGK